MDYAQYMGLLYGLVGVLLFRYKNPQREFLNTVSGLTLLIFATEVVFFEVQYPAGQISWAVSGTALVAAYCSRFYRKTSKSFIDLVKVFGIVLVALYPLNFYEYEMFENEQFVMIGITRMLIPVVACIYFYDRIILNPEPMKRKFIWTLVLQTVIIFIVLVYAFFQQTQANKARVQAEINAQEALKQKALADVNATEAHKTELELSSQLEACKKVRK